MFGGPGNLRELARLLNKEGQYLVFYAMWSTVAHAENCSRFLTLTPEGAPAYQPLRDPRGFRAILQQSILLLNRATRLTLGKFRPGEQLRDWYLREVRDRLHQIAAATQPFL
jgi:hypothetical protein